MRSTDPSTALPCTSCLTTDLTSHWPTAVSTSILSRCAETSTCCSVTASSTPTDASTSASTRTAKNVPSPATGRTAGGTPCCCPTTTPRAPYRGSALTDSAQSGTPVRR